jgi:hypothetical protein
MHATLALALDSLHDERRMSDRPKQRRRQPNGLTAPHPNSPSGRNFDYLYFVGAPHPNSPAGRDYDYRSTLGIAHPNSPAGRADLHRATRAMRQVQRDYYRLGSDIAAAELEARVKAREVTLRILSRIKDEVTTVALAPLAVHEPSLFLHWTVGTLVDDFREARRDRLTFREFLLEELKQVVDSVDELKDIASEGPRPRRVSNWSKIRGLAWSALTDVDVVRGVLDVFHAANLQARTKTLEERQAYLATRHAYIKRELQRCVEALRRSHGSGPSEPSAEEQRSTQHSNAGRRTPDQFRTERVDRKDVVDKDASGDNKRLPVDLAEDAKPTIECFACPAGADPVEFERAVRMAEDELNKLSPERFLRRLRRLELRTAEVLRDRKTVKRTHRKARREWVENYLTALPFLSQGLLEEVPLLTPQEANESIERERKRLHLEHRLDIGGGGSSKKFAGLGDSLINESMGGQWKGRLPALKEIAEKARRQGQKSMNVRLRICPQREE